MICVLIVSRARLLLFLFIESNTDRWYSRWVEITEVDERRHDVIILGFAFTMEHKTSQKLNLSHSSPRYLDVAKGWHVFGWATRNPTPPVGFLCGWRLLLIAFPAKEKWHIC